MSKKHKDISTYFVLNKRSRGNSDEKNNLQHIHDVRKFYRFFRKKFDPPPDKNPGYVPVSWSRSEKLSFEFYLETLHKERMRIVYCEGFYSEIRTSESAGAYVRSRKHAFIIVVSCLGTSKRFETSTINYSHSDLSLCNISSRNSKLSVLVLLWATTALYYKMQ